MVNIRFWQVDAFADQPFRGNSAAVCFLETEANSAWMQQVAAEMNLAETAFVRQLDAGYELRWFSPTTEVDLCGHATLATAHALWESGLAQRSQPLRFSTRSGVLTCTASDNGLELDFPATPAVEADAPPMLLDSLQVKPLWVGKSKFDYLIEIESEEELLRLQPDYSLMAKVDTRGVIVTCQSCKPQFDFLSRFFAPRVGIAEDPVTGSAHCCLGPFWSVRLGRQDLNAFQASPRTGTMSVQVDGDRVRLLGQAVTVLRGELLATPPKDFVE